MVLIPQGDCTKTMRASLSIVNVLPESHRSGRGLLVMMAGDRLRYRKMTPYSYELGFLKLFLLFYFIFLTFQLGFTCAVIVITMPIFVLLR